jgi:tetratricopeptide (TPR) repeat protein
MATFAQMTFQAAGLAFLRLKHWQVAASLLPILFVSTPAIAAVDGAIRSALALHAQGKAPEALSLLLPLENERAGDPDFDYALGLAAADSGNTGRAIAAFQRVLAVQPNNAQARAEIARVYAMAGDLETAKTEFDTVIADPSLPDPVRQQLNRLSRTYGQAMRGGPRQLTGFIDLEGGDDSNINSATSATSITLPIFAFLGPATLSGGATQQSEAFSQIQAGLSAEAPLSRQTKIFGSALGLWRDSFNSDDFDQGIATGTFGIAHSLLSGDVVSLSGQGQGFWLANDLLRTSAGAIGQYTHRLSGGDALSLAIQFSKIDYENDSLRNADRFSGTVSYAGQQIYAALGVGSEETHEEGAAHFGYGFASFQAGFEHPLSDRFAVSAGLNGEYRDYNDQDPLFGQGRLDAQIDASLGLRAAIGTGLTLRPRLTYTRNDSNLELYDYDRVTASISIRKEF